MKEENTKHRNKMKEFKIKLEKEVIDLKDSDFTVTYEKSNAL